MTPEPAHAQIRELEALVLFGSTARGDSDAGSDVDVAAFGESTTMADLIGLKTRLSRCVGEHVSLSVYSKATAELMASSGSLFLWHLRLEGKVITQKSDWFGTLLRSLVPYSKRKAEADLDTFASVLKDTADALRQTEATLLFEAANLFAVLRSLGMIASMLDQQPCFSRLGPIRHLVARIGNSFSLSENEVDVLRDARLFYSGKVSQRPELDPEACRSMTAKVSRIAEIVRRSVYS